MKIPSENELDRIRREYPVGTIIELISMPDKFAVRITCYGQTEVWDDRKEATDFFLEAIAGSDGSECDRYSKIYAELMSGKTECSDEDESL